MKATEASLPAPRKGAEVHSKRRSFTKGLVWRIIATFTTVMISLQLTGHLGAALQIGPADFVLKLGAFYLHERAWLRPYAQHLARAALIKVCTWKLLAITLTTTTVFVVTGDLTIAAKLGPADFLVKLFLYAMHEHVWDRYVSWGRTLDQTCTGSSGPAALKCTATTRSRAAVAV